MDLLNSKLIINADDYGASNNRNEAIAYCFEKNIINSTTIMVTTKSFDEAIILAKKFNFSDKIGIHLNLTHEKPLTDLTNTGLIDNEGFFLRNAVSNPSIFFSNSIKMKIRNELQQQYNKLIATNIIPTHIDSHHHVHTIPWIAKLFIDLAKKENTKLRITNDRFRKNFVRLSYNKLLNRKYKKEQLNFSDRFERVQTFLNQYNKLRDNDLTYEIMVHPAYEKSVLIDAVDQIKLEDSLINVKNRFYS